MKKLAIALISIAAVPLLVILYIYLRLR